jgi:thioredoxin 1
MKQQATRTDRIETTTAKDFSHRVLKAEGPIAVEFMSYSCAYCQALEPVLQQVTADLGDRVRILRVNIAVDPELAAGYRILATPTMVMFLNGSAIGRVEGPHPEISSLLAAITEPFQS